MSNVTETPYVETEVVLAVMNEDEERARLLIRDMSKHERQRLYRHLNEARYLLEMYGA